MADINNAKRDGNRVTSMLFKGSDGLTYNATGDEITGRLYVDLAGGGGTVTSISGGTGILLTPDPITTTGSVALATSLQPIASFAGNAGKFLRVNAGETAVEYATVAAGGITIGTTTITSGTNTRILYNNAGVVGEYTLSGTGTVVAMQTSPSFVTPDINVATADSLQAGTASSGLLLKNNDGVTVASFGVGSAASTNISLAGSVALGTNSITMTGSLGTTGARLTKGWFTDIESTNIPTVGGTAILTSLTSPSFTTVELGAGGATDTTLSRVSAGVVAIEGVNILTTATGLPLAGGTMSGNITLGENTSIALDPAGSADGKYTGITMTATAGYTQAFGDLVYLAVADSRWELADADAITTGGQMLAMVVVPGTDGNACTLLLQGQIRADAKFPTLTVGAPVYVGETAGEIQVAIPTGADNVIRVVGYALTANEIYFSPSGAIQTTVA